MPTDDRVHITFTGAERATTTIPVTLEIRLTHDFDTTYFRDRVSADLFANGRRLGIHARAIVEDDNWRGPADAIQRYGPDLHHAVLAEFSKGLTLASRVADLEALGSRERLDNLEAWCLRLHEDAAAHRRPWWRKAYDRAGAWISGVR